MGLLLCQFFVLTVRAQKIEVDAALKAQEDMRVALERITREKDELHTRLTEKQQQQQQQV